jgi:ammonia channel protein AmtB
MVDAKNSSIGKDGIYKITDASAVLMCLLVYLFWLVIAFIFNGIMLEKGSYGILIILNGFLLLTAYRLKAIWGGNVLNLQQRTLEFAGGGISANEMSDYINLNYLLQFFKRSRINIDDIGHMEVTEYTTKTWNKTTQSYNTRISYSISISGPFGAVSIPFSNQGKCNEMYSAIRQLNKMGSPIVRA